MIQKFYTLMLLSLFVASSAVAQNIVTVGDDDLVGGETYLWTNDNEYHLDGFVFLEEGGELFIEQGTVIKGLADPSTDDLASSLIITRDAKIFAQGTANQPIIFTTEIDDTDDPNDMFLDDRGLWGGLIVLGNAPITDETNEQVVEGLPVDDPRSLYGGDNPEDNSGIIRYVSVRHGGAELAPGEEINGISLGGVGSGTTMEYVEVLANSDDGIEWFGGTVSTKYAVVAFCGDDGYDYDTGWLGNGQFFFCIQGTDAAGNGGEHDGAKPDENTPSSNPTIYNATYIGSGIGADAGNEHALLLRDGSRGTYANSIFTSFANYALQVEDLADGVDSYQYLQDGELNFLNNIWFEYGQGDELAEIIQVTEDAEDDDASDLIAHLADNGNTLEDPMLAGISRANDGGLDPRVMSGSPAFNDLADYPDDDFFTPVNFKGAFGDDLWLRGWSALEEYGVISAKEDVVITDDDLVGGEDYVWTSDNCYLLDGFVFLEEGGTLTIEPGTVIKGLADPSTDDLASSLIITRGAQIFAEGTQGAPIIFTTEIDDTNDPNDMFLDDRGLWGGLIILGNAPITDETEEQVIEGLPVDDPRSLYGGDNADDNSGVLRFVSVRHGGAELAPGEEINGISLGGVGSGTVMEYIEVLANSDDGIEWFGGTVSTKYATVAFCGDDSYDYDTGWLGNGQFFFSLQGSDAAGNGGEHDGAKPDENTPSSNPLIYNATYIGSGIGADAGNEHALLLRDGSRGTYANSIFTEFANYAIQVEDLADGVDSYQYLQDGELNLLNNIWWDYGQGDELAEIIQVTEGAEDDDASDLIDHLASNNNTLEDPMLRGISREANGMLDPRPMDLDAAPYAGVLAGYPSNDFHSELTYKGAFCEEGVWIQGWTALAEYGVLSADIPFSNCVNVISSVDEPTVIEESGYKLVQSFPNPTSGMTNIQFTLPETSNVTLAVTNMQGQVITRVLDNDRLGAGDHTVEFNASNLPNGMYFYTLVSGDVFITKTMVVQQ
ncbi:MAG: T9SS type A sorting domain-containing protein [Bacteroidetes bacterium]|jgi:hypothetical protein|nr:T9SS type A sorting domain-containing protein [Bacteroidota bacterium]